MLTSENCPERIAGDKFDPFRRKAAFQFFHLDIAFTSQIADTEGILANDSNFDRNPSRGCNFDLEGGAILNLRGCIAFMLRMILSPSHSMSGVVPTLLSDFRSALERKDRPSVGVDG